MAMDQTSNVDPAELAKFNALASRWWDPEGDFRPLHEINPLRLDWIRQHAELGGKTVVDIGCGGGILTESMAAAGARVLGIDMADGPLTVAKLHLAESGATVTYEQMPAEALATARAGEFDVVTCLEMLEHVPDPSQVIRSCAELIRPGGQVFFSTINRNAKSFLFAIVGAEYVLGMIPRGTHEYLKLIRPAELTRWCRQSGLMLKELTGLHFNPLLKDYSLGGNVDVNYFAHTRKPEPT